MSTVSTPGGPLGKPRGIGFGILLFIVTIGPVVLNVIDAFSKN